MARCLLPPVDRPEGDIFRLVGGHLFRQIIHIAFVCPINLEYPKCDLMCLDYIEEK
jgi:hypothetical protein